MPLIHIQIPSNAEVGDALTFSVEGTDFEIPIPEGSKAGDVLQIQVGFDGQEDEENQNTCTIGGADEETLQNDNEEVMIKSEPEKSDYADGFQSYIVPLHETLGITLEMQHLSTLVEESAQAQNEKIYNDGTCAMVWPSALHMTRYITSPSFQEIVKNKKSIVELGSGLGVVGLSYSAAVTSTLSNSDNHKKEINILLTDVPAALPLIEHNIACNRKRSPNNEDMFQNVTAESLIWGSHIEKSCSLAGKADLILASDILYNATIDTYDSLCETIRSLLPKSKGGSCDMLIAVRWRKPDQERKFFEIMESQIGFQFELVDGAMENEECKCILDWKSFGNPLSENSNEYFTNTFTLVNGVSLALKDVTEVQMNEMSEDEYQSFEAKYIQIYFGRVYI